MGSVNAQIAMLTGTPSTPAGTPRGTRDDSSDTMSETDSQKSLRVRRKLPHLPADQEAAPLPSHKKNSFGLNAKDRVRYEEEEVFKTFITMMNLKPLKLN